MVPRRGRVRMRASVELGGSLARNWQRRRVKKVGRRSMRRDGLSARHLVWKIGREEFMSCLSFRSSTKYQLIYRSHVLTLLGLKVASNTSPLLLIPPPSPPSLPLPHQALWAQIAFEDLHVPAFSIIPAPLASLFAVGATTGIVLHIGRDRSEVSVVTDSIIRWECSTTVEVGYGDCEVWFEDLLMRDADLDKNLQMNLGGDGTWEAGQKERMIKEVAKVIWTECTGDDLEIPPAEAGSKAIAAVTAQAQEDESFDVAKK
jgi:actin-related protein 9